MAGQREADGASTLESDRASGVPADSETDLTDLLRTVQPPLVERDALCDQAPAEPTQGVEPDLSHRVHGGSGEVVAAAPVAGVDRGSGSEDHQATGASSVGRGRGLRGR